MIFFRLRLCIQSNPKKIDLPRGRLLFYIKIQLVLVLFLQKKIDEDLLKTNFIYFFSYNSNSKAF